MYGLCCHLLLQLQVFGASSDNEQQRLQARQINLRMLSLLCYSAGPLDVPEMAQMLRLMVRSRLSDKTEMLGAAKAIFWFAYSGLKP